MCGSAVPITYTTELSWQQELLRLAPTLLLIVGYVWFTRRQMGGLGGGGGGGARGIFNVGKAQVRGWKPFVLHFAASYILNLKAHSTTRDATRGIAWPAEEL